MEGQVCQQTPQGVLPYKCEEGAHREISRKPLKGTRILFYGRVPNLFPSLRGTNSISTNHITGTVNFNSNKDNFRTLSSQGLFESIVINLYLAAVILGFSTQSCNNPKIWTPRRYDEHSPHFYRGVPPREQNKPWLKGERSLNGGQGRLMQ